MSVKLPLRKAIPEPVCLSLTDRRELDACIEATFRAYRFLRAQTGALLRPNGAPHHSHWHSAQALHLFGAYSAYSIQPAIITHLGHYFGIGRLFRVPDSVQLLLEVHS